MSKLQAFMSANVDRIENKKFVISNRFKDNSGKPIEWEIRAVTSAEEEQIRSVSRKRIVQNGRTENQDVDYQTYLSKLVVGCIVFPDLHDVELQNSYGVMGAEALLKAMLVPGELALLTRAIHKMNGFDRTVKDMVEEAKN